MFNPIFKDKVILVSFMALLALLVIRPAVAQEKPLAPQEKSFAQRGTLELGGSVSFKSSTPVAGGQTGSALNIFTALPFAGYFVTDGFELGVNPLGLMTASSGGNSTTQLLFLFAPSFNFKTGGGIAFPFVEALGGYTSISGTNFTTSTGYALGGRAGLKLAVTGHGLLLLGGQYLLFTSNDGNPSGRNGSNELTISAGFTVWF